MISSFILNVLREKDTSILEKIQELKKYYSYYRNLKQSLKDGTLYVRRKNQDVSFQELIQEMNDFDYALIRRLLADDVKNFLKENKLKSSLNFISPEDFVQIGFGAIFITKPISILWTTGIATFYLPTKQGIDNNFKIDFFSIPPITIEIWFEDTIEKKIEMGILSSKSVELKIDSSKVKDSVSEIYVTTDRLWLSNKIINQDKSILLGVGIKSISNLTCNS